MSNKKKKTILIISILILGIIILILNIILNVAEKKQQENLIKYELKKQENDEYYKGKIFPSGISKLKYLYTKNGGIINQNYYYEQLNSLVKYFIKISNNISESEIETFYDRNRNSILKNIGTNDKENFSRIIETIKKIDNVIGSFGEYKNSVIDTENIVFEDGYCIFDTIIYFDNYEKGITFKTYFSLSDINKSQDKNIVYFIIK